jgi:cation diffusion facilitator CzcD-associated flavoprotein CzcO
VLLEQAPHVAPAWRRHYERLHLHTPARHSSLPHLPMPASYPRYPSRQQVVDYLDGYAAKLGLRPTLRTTVTRIERSDGAWELSTSDGALRAASVVLCTGYNNVPLVPDWPGRDRFAGEAMHSSGYRTGERFKGRRVLVVGAGNSGAEIALDLLEHGARPMLCIRGPLHVVGRDVGPLPALDIAIAMEPLPDALRSAVMRAASLARYGSLRRWGIRRPRDGMLAQIRRGRIPLIDVGTIAAIRRRQIEVVPGIAEFRSRSVRFANGEERTADAVVFATGYRTGLPDLLPGLRSSFDAKGLPASVPCLAEAPNLYFVGFENSETGLLRAIARRAAEVAERVGSFHP